MMIAKIYFIWCFSLMMLVMGGCFSYHAAKGKAVPSIPIAADAWVEPKDVDGLQSLLETPREIQMWEIDRELIKKHYPELTDEKLDEIELSLWLRVTDARDQSGGIVRFWNHTGEGFVYSYSLSRGLFSVRIQDFESDGAFLSAARLPYLQAKRQYGTGDFRVGLIESLLKARGLIRTGAEREWFLRDGIRIGLPSDTGDQDRLGTIVHIASFYENEYEHRLLDRLEGYGWAIGHIESDVEIQGPQAIEQLEQRGRRQDLRKELMAQDPYFVKAEQALKQREGLSQLEMDEYEQRYLALNKRVDEQCPRLDDGLGIRPDTDIILQGRMLAGLFDQRIAEHAYAAQALVEESDRVNPQLADKPIVVFGFSAGALVAPAVVARLHAEYPNRKIALIMLGGGGDLLSVSIKSVFRQAKINLTPRDGPKPTQAQLDELVTHYRAASKLDPLALAPVIRDIPTLHIFAARDTIVPASTARAFNEAHGHVDRLVYPFNHETLFYFATGEVGRIHSWMRKHGLMD